MAFAVTPTVHSLFLMLALSLRRGGRDHGPEAVARRPSPQDWRVARARARGTPMAQLDAAGGPYLTIPPTHHAPTPIPASPTAAAIRRPHRTDRSAACRIA